MITLTTLKRIMREGAGQVEGDEWEGEIGDTLFEELGYDSIALLETVTRVERVFGIAVPDGAATEAKTPNQMLALVNSALGERG